MPAHGPAREEGPSVCGEGDYQDKQHPVSAQVIGPVHLPEHEDVAQQEPHV